MAQEQTPKGAPTYRGRHKLDPRLEMLLGMDPVQRTELARRERQGLREVCGALQHGCAELAALQGDDRAQAERALHAAHTRLFAPLTTGLRETSPAQALDQAASPQTEFSAFIVADASPEHLEQLGARIRTQAGDVFTAFIPESAMERLEASPAVRYIELARSVFPTLVASPAIQAEAKPPAAYRRPPDGPQGKGTIVGIVDTALDLYHADFRAGPDNGTRVLYLWDQTLVPQGGESSPTGWLYKQASSYGVEYDAAKINEQLHRFPVTPPYQLVRHNAQGEMRGHGTMVTGVAAGNARTPSSHGPHLGAAPAADIIFVALPDPLKADVLADTAQVMDAFSYIFARADALRKPCVINMSQGDNLGPHDGSSIGERFLDALLETPGRVITLSAGNSTSTASHATGTLRAGEDRVVTIECDPGQNRNEAIDLWYAGDDVFEIELTVPGLDAPLGPVAPDSAPVAARTPQGVDIDMRSVRHALNGENHVSIQLLVPPGGTLPAGTLGIRLRAKVARNGRFHAWIDRNNREELPDGSIAPHVRFTSDVDEGSVTLGSPGTARRPITVGNHDAEVPPRIFQTSGLGPTRDQRVKPEIAAFGVQVPAPYSWDRSKGVPSAFYGAFTGTSASAPLVAGACACLFESRGAALTWSHLKQILEDTAGTDGIVVPDGGFGFGYMRFDALLATPPAEVDVWIKHALDDAGQEPRAAAVEWMSPDIELLDMERRPTANPARAAQAVARNIVRVRVRNRGMNVARDTAVRLLWAEGATHVPIPGGWSAERIYRDARDGFGEQGNERVIPAIGPGEFAQVEFGFAAPDGAGEAPIAFLVQLDHPDDRLDPRRTGRLLPGMRNNVGMRCVRVADYSPGDTVSMSFRIVGSARDDGDSLAVMPDLPGGEISVYVPESVLPEFVRERVRNAKVTVNGDRARLRLDGGDLYVPRLRLEPGTQVEAVLEVRGPQAEGAHRFVHVAHRAGGELVGGVSLELRPR